MQPAGPDIYLSAMPPPKNPKDTLVRRLALAKLRELRRDGWSFREIGLRYRPAGRPGTPGTPGTPVNGERLTPAGLLAPDRRRDSLDAENGDDTMLFLRALDALDQGLAFFDTDGALLNANRSMEGLLEGSAEDQLRAELCNFAETLWRLTRLRGLADREAVEELAEQEIPLEPTPLVMKGSYIGLDLFGSGPSVLVALERPPEDPLSPESLQLRFGLTPSECRIAQLLAQGSPNAEIAEQVMLSPHTIRRHTENILRKLDVRSRAEAVVRMLRDE